MHIDPDYARRTPFGECIVHGVLGILRALGEATDGAPVKLRRLEARFLRPLLAGRRYPLSIERAGEGRLVAVVGAAPRLRVEVEHELAAGPWQPPPPAAGYAPLAAARELDPAAAFPRELSGDYEIVSSALTGDVSPFERASLPASQLAALLWSSYFVGMELPGKQALFRSLSIDFADRFEPDSARLGFGMGVEAFQRETSVFTVAGALSSGAAPLARVRLTAAHRPPPVAPSLEGLGASTALAGKWALVTGSSRGLGARIALACALQGADVIVHARESLREAQEVAGLIEQLGRRARLVRGDVREGATWAGVRDVIETVGLDLFVQNASPLILPAPLAEIEDAGLEAPLAALQGAFAGLRTVLPVLAKRNGCVVNVSAPSAARGARELAPEAALKAALEGLVLSLAAEYRTVRFVNARPPRMLTDRTNEIIPSFRGRSPSPIAERILRAVLEPSATNHVTLDAFD